MPNLNNEEIAEAAGLFISSCEQKKSSGITDGDIQNFIQQAQETVDPRRRLEKERIEKEEAKAEAAKAKAEATEKDSIIAELKQQLIAALAGQQVVAPQSTPILAPAYTTSLNRDHVSLARLAQSEPPFEVSGSVTSQSADLQNPKRPRSPPNS